MPATNPERDPVFRGLMVVMAAAVVVALIFDGVSKGRPASTSQASTSGAAGAGSGAGRTIAVGLKDFSISPATINAPVGSPLSLSVSNQGQSPHQFAVSVSGKTIQTPMLDPGSTATLSLPSLAQGSYRAWCTVPGHEGLGMKATLVAGRSSGSSDQGSGGAVGGMPGMGTMPGMGGSQSGSAGSMTSDQMARMHEQSMKAFPAKTTGQGNQILHPTMENGVKVFHLMAMPLRWEVSPGQFVTAFAYNNQVPGPQIRVHQGNRIKVILTNHLAQPTTIHWHGVTVPNGMDGVPYVTQDPVMPGQTFTYRFKVVDPPGTYLYHSHFNSTDQVAGGLYGSFVVEPRHPTWDVEYTEILNDGPLGYTIDGKGWPATAPLVAKLGESVLIRLANVGQMLHPLHLHGYHFTVLSQDGASVQHPYSADTLVVAPGETYDVLVHATHPGVWALHCHILSHVEGPQGMFGMATALVVS